MALLTTGARQPLLTTTVAPSGSGGYPGAQGRGIGDTVAGSDSHIFAAGTTQLIALAAQTNTNVDEANLFRIVTAAHTRIVGLEQASLEIAGSESARQLAQSVLELCNAWFRLAAGGGLVEGSEGLRGATASEYVCSTVVTILASELPFSAALLPAFSESGGLGLFGAALCHFDESVLVAATKKLRYVAVRCSAHIRREHGGQEALIRNVEAFRSGLFHRLPELAAKPGRQLRAKHFKELVAELGGVLSSVYSNTQVFEMGCLLSLQLTVVLLSYCPGVPEQDAVIAVDWMATVVGNLLDQEFQPEVTEHDGEAALANPEYFKEWIADNGLWSTLLLHAACSTQTQVHKLFTVLLTKRVFTPRELVGALSAAGTFPPSHVTPPSRLAIQGALLAAMPALGVEAIVDVFNELSCILEFEHLTEEGVDLLVKVTQQALAAGYKPAALPGDAGFRRSLAFTYLLRYLHWGHQQPELLLEVQLDHAHRALLHTLAPHPALMPLLPSLVAEALLLAASPARGQGVSNHCIAALSTIAVDAARTGVAATAAATGSPARVLLHMPNPVAKLCSALQSVGPDQCLSSADAQIWATAFVDALAIYLQVPGAQVDSAQVSTLWSRLVVQRLFGLPGSVCVMQYFKIAFLAQPSASAALLAPLATAQALSPEVEMAYSCIFCPASFPDDPPPLSASFFFPELSEARTHSGAVVQMVMPREESPPSSPPQRINSAQGAVADMGGDDQVFSTDLAAAAASAGIVLPDTSDRVPRLHLDQLPERSSALFGELTVYDAIERRLWDDIYRRGRIDDSDALRQRDAAAERCLTALNQAVDTLGNVPMSIAEAQAKFAHLCEKIRSCRASAESIVQQTARTVHAQEELRAKAEEDLTAAKFAQARDNARKRRCGEPLAAPTPELDAAREKFSTADVQLVAELRTLAAWAQLGLVELASTPGLSRSLRALGTSHKDPLLDRLRQHGPWMAAQAEDDAGFIEVLKSTKKEAAAALNAKDTAKALLDDPALQRPDGLACYTELRQLAAGGKIFSARHRGVMVALKKFDATAVSTYQREIVSLSALRHAACVVSLTGAFSFQSQGAEAYYLELSWCSGGTLHDWCAQHPGVVQLADAEAFVKCLGIFRQVWHAVAHVHSKGAAHGDLSLLNVLLTADHRPVLADFSRCTLAGGDVGDWQDNSVPTAGYAAPEIEELCSAGAKAAPTQVADVYAAGVMMGKAFLGLGLEVASCQYDPVSGRRGLPEDRTDVDLADLLQAALARDPGARPSAEIVALHRSMDPANFLRRKGLLGHSRNRSPSEGLLNAAEQLREEYRGRRVDEPLIFAREGVFDAIGNSKIGEWTEDALLGEWRVVLDGESGVDAGGLRREVVTLFFEQLEQSNLVERLGAEGAQPTLFMADRQKADRSPQQWRQIWSAVGAMILRAVVHFGNAPVAFSGAVFDCAFGRMGKLPPDDADYEAEEGSDDTSTFDAESGLNREQWRQLRALVQHRSARGDDWARSELLDLLRRLRRADMQKERSYRWMLAQRISIVGPEAGRGMSSVYTTSKDALETFSCMLDKRSHQFLVQSSHMEKDGSIKHSGAVLEWTLLWDVYLKYLGGGDRWLAYEALANGLSAGGRRTDIWLQLTGEQTVEALEGVSLTPDIVIANLEFKPPYGYDKQIQSFKAILANASAEELSMFLRFATGIGRLPANRRFPNGQKLTIRFLPDQLDRLPQAHTCFWIVDVPPYDDELDMEQKLRQAIAAPQPFTFS